MNPNEALEALPHRPVAVALGAYRAEIRRQALLEGGPNERDADAIIACVADVANALEAFWPQAGSGVQKTVAGAVVTLHPELATLFRVCARSKCREPVLAVSSRTICSKCHSEMN